MKERILLALKQIIERKSLEDSEYADLFQRVGKSHEEFVERAQQLQTLILHNYDDFSISTIDSFVHSIIRTFATDVKLPQNFEVVIDEDDFIPDIVSEILERVGHDSALTEIMVNFVMSQTEHEKNYNISASLTQFVKKQIGEESFKHLQKIDDLNTSDFAAIVIELNKKRTSLKATIKNAASKALDLIHANGLGKNDFYQTRSGIYVYFTKCSKLLKDDDLDVNSYVNDTITNDRWTGAKPDPSTLSAINSIKDSLIDEFDVIGANKDNYIRLSLIHKKIYALALTHEIRSVFLDFTDRTQKVHISEFNKRISNEIADQPVPFIYERLGRKYKYFLIDEFQDTSVLQWQNLLPLIEESLAYDRFNMLVGDAKQSIYRFRSGEVELFVNLPKMYNNDGSALSRDRERVLKANYKEVLLFNNWRSERVIVEFNNAFFDSLKSGLSEHIQEIYANHKQEIPESKTDTEGFVSVGFIETEKADEYALLRLGKIKEQVEHLLSNGYLQNDICVLTRTNSYAIEIASFLMQHGFNVVSSESLLLIYAPEVRLIASFYGLLLHPNEKIYLAEFVSNLIKTKGFKGEFHQVFELALTGFSKGLNALFNTLSLNISLNEVVEKPVYEIAEYLIRKLNLNQTSNIYLHYFLDFVFEAQESGKGLPGDFLDYWEQKKSKVFISMPEDGNAIKIMTVHKAKGLKFEAVIVDLINRGSKKGKDEHWIDLNEPGLEKLKVGLLGLNNSLEKIGLKNVVEREDEKTQLDFVNLVYVAFTRAVSALFITGNIVIGRKADSFTAYLIQFLTHKGMYSEDKTEYQFGKLSLKKDEQKVQENNIVQLDKLTSSAWEDQIRIAPADDVYWEALDSKPARTYGNLVHAMLAKVEYADDVKKVVKIYQNAGIIDKEESLEIENILNDLVVHPDLKQFYKKGVLVKNEIDLLEYDSVKVSAQRPDRVVIDGNQLTIIDYKTGEKETKHKKQIEKYAESFRKLGYKQINKKLVYINDDIEVVDI